MHDRFFFDGRIIRQTEALIEAVSAAVFYGKGIFTTIAIRKTRAFLWEKHWRRLQNAGIKLQIDHSAFSEESVRRALEDIVLLNNVDSGRARITFIDAASGGLWQKDRNAITHLLITTADARLTPSNFHLTVSPYRINSTSPLAGIKSCNYLERILGLEEAKKRGFDEAVCLNERGEIASAIMSNIFWMEDGKLLTPPLNSGCMQGTTREFVMENIECMEIEADMKDLQNAEAIFLTSAGLGIIRVAEFEGRRLGGENDEILNLRKIEN